MSRAHVCMATDRYVHGVVSPDTAMHTRRERDFTELTLDTYTAPLTLRSLMCDFVTDLFKIQ